MTTANEMAKLSDNPALAPKEDANTKMPCPRCRELIERGAEICKHCQSEITWRRFFHFGNTALALLVALAALLSTAVPAIINWLASDDTAISGVFVGTVAEDIKYGFIVTNRGKTGGVVRGGQIDIRWGKNKENALRLSLLTDSDRSAYFIVPNETRQVIMMLDAEELGGTRNADHLDQAIRYLRDGELRDCNASAQLEVVNASGRISQERVGLTCTELKRSFFSKRRSARVLRGPLEN